MLVKKMPQEIASNEPRQTNDTRISYLFQKKKLQKKYTGSIYKGRVPFPPFAFIPRSSDTTLLYISDTTFSYSMNPQSLTSKVISCLYYNIRIVLNVVAVLLYLAGFVGIMFNYRVTTNAVILLLLFASQSLLRGIETAVDLKTTTPPANAVTRVGLASRLLFAVLCEVALNTGILDGMFLARSGWPSAPTMVKVAAVAA